MHETHLRSRASPPYSILLDHKTILNTDQNNKSEDEKRGIRLSEQHNQIASHQQREK